MEKGVRVAYPHKTRRTPGEHTIRICNLPFPPCSRCSTSCSSASGTASASNSGSRKTDTAGCKRGTGGGAFDIVIEALDYVPCGCFFEVRLFEAEDLVFQLALFINIISISISSPFRLQLACVHEGRCNSPCSYPSTVSSVTYRASRVAVSHSMAGRGSSRSALWYCWVPK